MTSRQAGVLGAGAGPQQALGLRAPRRQRLPARPGEDLLVALVGQLGVGDGHLARQRAQQRLLPGVRSSTRQPLGDHAVEGGVDPADEEAGHAGHPGRIAAAGGEALQPLTDKPRPPAGRRPASNSRVALTLMPSPISCSMAAMPGAVAGTLIIRLSRPTAATAAGPRPGCRRCRTPAAATPPG